jgi:predicted nucleic acid-binding protein
MKIYLDICCFNRPFDDQSQLAVRLEAEAKLAIQASIRGGNLQLVWSYIMDFENSANPYEERRETIAPWKALATECITESDSLLKRADHFHALGLKPKDALHLACAVEANCEVFLTTDLGILKRNSSIPDLDVINPVEYITRR